MLKLALSLAAPEGTKGRLSVLLFHRVLDRSDPRHPSLPDVLAFDHRLRWLKSYFNVLPLADALDRLSHGTLPSRAAAITFDDGYADNVTCALPVLQQHGLHATFFIATGFLDGGIMWNDVLTHVVYETRASELDCSAVGLGKLRLDTFSDRALAESQVNAAVKHLEFEARSRLVSAWANSSGVELPSSLMMTSEQLRELHMAGMGIGAHTVGHPILARCSQERARSEIEDGRRHLQDILRAPIELFAYPNGKPGQDYLPCHVDLVRELGFKSAVTTAPGASDIDSDRFQIRRFTPWDRSRGRFALRMLQNLWTPQPELTRAA
jgi:peptidoglycan/xylan/chitin deacetylase (PgdA/CDA1 family)